MISIAEVATELNICKNLALSLPRFYKKTGISAQLSFVYSPDSASIEISLGFLPREPNEDEYNILFQEVIDAEKLLLSEYLINNSDKFENLNQLLYKHREEMKQIIERQKKENA